MTRIFFSLIYGSILFLSVLAPAAVEKDGDHQKMNDSSVAQFKPYLIFPGNCRQALEFYAECLEGKIVMIQTFDESPLDVPDSLKHRIFNSEFVAGKIRIMASDDLPGSEVKIGSNFALFITFSDEKEKNRVFEQLAQGGQVLFPIEDNFGMLVDKFGIRWMVESVNEK